jgi:hypothetical protein
MSSTSTIERIVKYRQSTLTTHAGYLDYLHGAKARSLHAVWVITEVKLFFDLTHQLDVYVNSKFSFFTQALEECSCRDDASRLKRCFRDEIFRCEFVRPPERTATWDARDCGPKARQQFWRQEPMIRAMAVVKGWDSAQVLVDRGEFSGDMERPGLQK